VFPSNVLIDIPPARFHPAIQRVKEILDSGELGNIKSLETSLGVPKGMFNAQDIRFDYGLGGGAMMDMGCKLIPS
jgi:predicted dehydrogenase